MQHGIIVNMTSDKPVFLPYTCKCGNRYREASAIVAHLSDVRSQAQCFQQSSIPQYQSLLSG
jgi:hypothetical protein